MSTCATGSRTLSEPLSATAATARTWLLIEQPGPWGSKALTGSHLDPELGRALEEAAAPHGVRVALIRRPGRHADRHGAAPGRAFLAHTAPGNSWMRGTVLEWADPGHGEQRRHGSRTSPHHRADADDAHRQLRELDFAALGAGDPSSLAARWQPHRGEPLVLVCTNGKRDRCCALRGRPLAAELDASATADTWEVTHIGGHRFAPTLLVLPYGYAYGRADAPSVKAAVEGVREGRVVTTGCRGRSTWERPGQAADLAVREHTGESRADALTVTAVQTAGAHWSVAVTHADGRRWRVTIAAEAGTPTPTSCGAEPDVPTHMRALRVEKSD